MNRCWLFLIAIIALPGCAPIAVRDMPAVVLVQMDEKSRSCARLLARVDAVIAREHVTDAMATPVSGFPYLRVNRFLASYRGEAMDDEQFANWSHRMAALAAQAYAIEIQNLSAPARGALEAGDEPLQQTLANCIARFQQSDGLLRSQALRNAAWVPDDYDDWKRIVGIYYLTRIPFAAGVRRSHRDMQALFERQPDTPAAARFRYQSVAPRLDRTQIRSLMQRARRGALDIPEPVGADLAALFATFAPSFEIDTQSSADHLGALSWIGSIPGVDSTRPVVYTHLSHTRVQGRALAQLNYVVWFPARPKNGMFDALGGHLDGLTWRVTLDESSVPLVFDSMHNCGCYHIFIPTRRAQARPADSSWDDPVLVPLTLGDVSADDRITLRADANSHYLYRVLVNEVGAAATLDYELRPYSELRTLARADGTPRSVFDERGLIRGSERLERYFFWPMAIVEPGAMRILGRHAIAFVGRRHFDDSDLLENNFIFAAP